MSTKLSRLREEHDRLVAQAQAINDKYPKNTPMPKAEVERLDTLLDNIEGVTRDIETERCKTADAGGQWQVDGRDVSVLRNAADIRRHYSSQARGVSDRERMSIADFVRGIAGLPTTAGVRAALTEGTDSEGGHLVPSLVMPSVLEAMMPASAVMTAGAGIIPTNEGAKSYTQAAIDTVPTAAWRLENGNVAESDPTFRGVVATPRSLAFFFKVSRELLADAANIEPALALAIGQAFAKALDRAALRGSAVAPEPAGLLATANVQSVSNGTNGASLAAGKYANLFSALQKILEADGPMPTAAIMSPRSKVVLGSLADSTGQPLQVPELLTDMRMLATTQVPNDLTVGSSSDCSEIYVGEFMRMAIMLRERMSIQKLDQLFATTGQIGFVCHVRADVMVQYPKAFAVVTGVRP
jgi:HK97 family phage major capsid protein